MVVQFYHAHPSPPSRAVYMTIRALGIEHDLHIINLFGGETKTPEYLQVNSRGKVPAIIDGGFKLGER